MFNSVRRKLPSTWLANKEVGTLCVMCVTFWLSLPASPAWLIMAGGLPSSELAIYALWIMTGWAGLAGLATIMYRLTG